MAGNAPSPYPLPEREGIKDERSAVRGRIDDRNIRDGKMRSVFVSFVCFVVPGPLPCSMLPAPRSMPGWCMSHPKGRIPTAILPPFYSRPTPILPASYWRSTRLLLASCFAIQTDNPQERPENGRTRKCKETTRKPRPYAPTSPHRPTRRQAGLRVGARHLAEGQGGRLSVVGAAAKRDAKNAKKKPPLCRAINCEQASGRAGESRDALSVAKPGEGD